MTHADEARRIVDAMKTCQTNHPEKWLEPIAAALAAAERAGIERAIEWVDKRERDFEAAMVGKWHSPMSSPNPDTMRRALLPAAVAEPAAKPESNRVYWFAETLANSGEYATRGRPGHPCAMTRDPLQAARFETRHECIEFCCGTTVRAILPPLHPVEHMFMDRDVAEPAAKCGMGLSSVFVGTNGELPPQESHPVAKCATCGITHPAHHSCTPAVDPPKCVCRECKVCCAKPDKLGIVTHGKGCYMLSDEGGGTSFEPRCPPCRAKDGVPMTAPTPSPEEFAKRVFPTKIRVGQCAIDCTTVEEADEMQSRLNAAAAALTAPLRAEVEDAKGALEDAAAHEDNDTASVADRIATLAEERDFFRSAWFAVLDTLYPHRLPDDQFDPKEVARDITDRDDREERAEAENARLRAALQPFAEFGAVVGGNARDHVCGMYVAVGKRRDLHVSDFRAAAKALAPEGGK